MGIRTLYTMFLHRSNLFETESKSIYHEDYLGSIQLVSGVPFDSEDKEYEKNQEANENS